MHVSGNSGVGGGAPPPENADYEEIAEEPEYLEASKAQEALYEDGNVPGAAQHGHAPPVASSAHALPVFYAGVQPIAATGGCAANASCWNASCARTSNLYYRDESVPPPSTNGGVVHQCQSEWQQLLHDPHM